MRYKSVKLDIILCEISIILVSICLLFLSVIMVVNIYTIYAGGRVTTGEGDRYLINTSIKTIEVCKYDLHFCSRLR